MQPRHAFGPTVPPDACLQRGSLQNIGALQMEETKQLIGIRKWSQGFLGFGPNMPASQTIFDYLVRSGRGSWLLFTLLFVPSGVP